MGSAWRLTALIGCAEIGPGFVQIEAAGSGGLSAAIDPVRSGIKNAA